MKMEDIWRLDKEDFEGFDEMFWDMEMVTYKEFKTTAEYIKHLKKVWKEYDDMGVNVESYYVDDEDDVSQTTYMYPTDENYSIISYEYVYDLVELIVNEQFEKDTIVYIQDGRYGIVEKLLKNNPMLQHRLCDNSVRIVACTAVD